MIRVTLDGAVLGGQSRRSGLGHYTRALLASLGARDDLHVVVLADRSVDLPPGVTRRVVRRLGRSRYEAVDNALRFSIDARRVGGDVFHVPAGLPPPLAPRPWVHTLHDLIPLESVDGEHPSPRRQWRAFGPLLRRADLVVAVSEFAAQSGREVLGLDPGRIVVIPHGVGPEFHPASSDEIGGHPYLVAVGEYSRRKGFDRAIAVVDELAHLGYPHHLHIVGNVNESARHELESVVRAARHPERILVNGYVPDLAAELRGAIALLAVSRYEGFGLPAAEAMACGTPVLGFATTATTEVVADGGILVDDGDVRALSAVVQRVIDDPGYRSVLATHALRRASAFSWSRAADSYVDVYRSVLGRTG